MLDRSSIGAIALATALMATITGAQAFDETKYPDFKGQWSRTSAPRWLAPGRKAPLTPEYQAVFDANTKDIKEGGPGDWPSSWCVPQGMPAMMNIYDPMEIIITPDTTYILISHVNDSYRRIFTDGRAWPAEGEYEDTYAGYSIGRWIDENGDGKYDVLEVETRHFKGPRGYDASGLPLHRDNKSIVKERFYVDKADPDVMFIDLTVIDNAMTQPFKLLKKVVRTKTARPVWRSETCSDNNSLVRIGTDTYFLSADGYLMPAKKNQSPPDLRYFKAAQ
jgi:hypothetical protein